MRNQGLGSLFHYDTALDIIVSIHFESFLLEVFDHCDIGLFKVSDAQLKYLHLTFYFSEKESFFKQRMEDAILSA